MNSQGVGITQTEANLITVITQVGYALGLLFIVPMADMVSVWPMEKDHKKTTYSRVTSIIDAHLSATYNVGNWFFNANAQFNNFFFRHDNNKGSFTNWYVNASIGIRL